MNIWILFTILSLISSFKVMSSDSLKVLSYNTGLAHTFVPLAKLRLPKIIEELKKSSSDVICLQEVWTKKDRKKIISSLRDEYPFYQRLKIKQKKSLHKPTCRKENLFGHGKFLTCVKTACKGTSGDGYTSCIIKKCRGALELLKVENSDCAQGIIAQVGKTTLQAIMSVFNPLKGAGLFSYKGSDGLLVLSKHKLYNKKSLELDDISTGTRRRMIFSHLKKNNKEIILACTHLTANLSRSVPYTGDFSSWETENFEQVKEIIKGTQDITAPIILAGDFNCSLPDSSRGVMSQFRASCDHFLDNGFDDGFAKENGNCTFCERNTLVRKTSLGARRLLLDHIYSKNIEVKSAKIMYKNLVLVLDDRDIKKTNLSDHFGVLVEFSL